MVSHARSISGAVERLLSTRTAVIVLATGAMVYMAWQAQFEWVQFAGSNGVGSDFEGTIWAPTRAILDGASPYPDASAVFDGLPAVYPPPIFLVTLPFGWLPLHVAIWVWFAFLLAAAIGVLAVLGVRDPWCYAFFLLSLPVVQALVLGNASILIAFGVALSWRFRDHPLLGPLAVAATVTVKPWIWPLIFWLMIRSPRAGVRAAVTCGALIIGAWAVIRFHGLLEYPDLAHRETITFAPAGVLYVAALMQFSAALEVAIVLGLLGGLALLVLAWNRRANELESFSLVLLAALVATPVAWPHYLILMAVPLAILWPRLSLAWAWFPALWLAVDVLYGGAGSRGVILALCVFAAVPVATVVVSRRRMQTPEPPHRPRPDASRA